MFSIIIGRVAALIPALLGAVGVLLMVRSDVVDLRPFRFGVGLLAVSLTTIFAAGVFGIGPAGPAPKTLDPSVVDDYGGLLGGAVAFASRTLIADTGTAILCVLGVMVGGLLVTGGIGWGLYAQIGARERGCSAAYGARRSAERRDARSQSRNRARGRSRHLLTRARWARDRWRV